MLYINYFFYKNKLIFFLILKIAILTFKIIVVKKLNKALKGYKHICFLDFEGTQFTHEMIAYGAVFVTLNKDGLIKNKKPILKSIVKAKNKVGSFVENLTGISDYDVKSRGVPFSQAIKDLKKYCGLYFNKTLFVTFGNHDFRIFSQSVAYNLDTPRDIAQVFQKNFFDFQSFIMEFCKDEQNNPYSLENYLKVYDIEFKGTAHDAGDDAYNLMLLYEAFLTKKDITLREYLKCLSNAHNLAYPIQKTVQKLSRGEEVTSSDFALFAKEYLS